MFYFELYPVLLARDYIQDQQSTQQTKGIICAFAGGSVGRGDADSYSDLDFEHLYIRRQPAAL